MRYPTPHGARRQRRLAYSRRLFTPPYDGPPPEVRRVGFSVVPDRDAISGKLQKELNDLIAYYETLSDEDLRRECTESEAPSGAAWAAKDHVAHLAMIERAFLGMISRGRAGDTQMVIRRDNGQLRIAYEFTKKEAAILELLSEVSGISLEALANFFGNPNRAQIVWTNQTDDVVDLS